MITPLKRNQVANLGVIMVNSGGQSISGANNWPTSIYEVAPDYLKIKIWDVARK
jgi:hypothetical protein